jgi:hypothetical protein
MQQYHETLFINKGRSPLGEVGKVRTRIWFVYSLYKNEYRNLKLTETTIRKDWGRMKKIIGDKPIGFVKHILMETSEGNSLCS